MVTTQLNPFTPLPFGAKGAEELKLTVSPKHKLPVFCVTEPAVICGSLQVTAWSF
ncbi:MAG: hypothetical protein IPP32_10410 [Bacteroidetes bacterium]|nr:hypothetical protein [Bacteroidota bacterium]